MVGVHANSLFMIVHLFWVNISALLNVNVNFRSPAAAAPVTSDKSICSYWTAADMRCTSYQRDAVDVEVVFVVISYHRHRDA